MSRIQNILDKAEREGATLRTSRVGVPPAGVSVPRMLDIPPQPGGDLAGVIAPGAPAVNLGSAAAAVAEIESFAVRLNPMLVAGLAPASPAAEQYRTLRTRLGQAEGTSALRSVLITSPQKGEGKSITAANLALTMAQELQRRVVIVEAD